MPRKPLKPLHGNPGARPEKKASKVRPLTNYMRFSVPKFSVEEARQILRLGLKEKIDFIDRVAGKYNVAPEIITQYLEKLASE